MKIVILTQYFLPEMGAPQNRLYELASGWQEMGWTVEIITAMPNYPTGKIFPAYQGKFQVDESITGIPVHRYWLYPSKSSRAIPRIISMLSFSMTALFSWLKIRRLRPDYLLVESPPLTLAFSGWLLARLAGSKLIMNVSDLWPLSARELGALSGGWFYRRLEGLEFFLYKKADICLGQSQQIVDHISGRKNGRVWLFRNGVDTSRFSAPFGRRRNYRIVYAGLLGVAQGVFEICEAINFAEMGIEFHIYGSGNEQERIEEFVKTNAQRGIFYKGVVDRDHIPSVLVQYDATLVSLVRSIYGAVPSKMYEAMAGGLPIIFSGAGEGARIVGENSLGWTNDPGDWATLKNNLGIFSRLTEPEWQVMRTHVFETACKKFDRKAGISSLSQKLGEASQ